jgi:hypothetical protein
MLDLSVYHCKHIFYNLVMTLFVLLPLHFRINLVLKEEKLKCLTFQLHMARLQWGLLRIGGYAEFYYLLQEIYIADKCPRFFIIFSLSRKVHVFFSFRFL